MPEPLIIHLLSPIAFYDGQACCWAVSQSGSPVADPRFRPRTTNKSTSSTPEDALTRNYDFFALNSAILSAAFPAPLPRAVLGQGFGKQHASFAAPFSLPPHGAGPRHPPAQAPPAPHHRRTTPPPAISIFPTATVPGTDTSPNYLCLFCSPGSREHPASRTGNFCPRLAELWPPRSRRLFDGSSVV